MGLSQRLGAEVVASFVLAWEAIIVWEVVLPNLSIVERAIRRPGQWSQLAGVLTLSLTYYALLSLTMRLAKAYNPRIHPITTAYLGGWWLVILTAILSARSAAFNTVLGLSMATQGANLIFITLFVGTAKYWIDAYLHPPQPPRSDGDK